MLTRLVVQRREPFARGYEFPITGAYEKLVGRLYGEVDPKNRLNKIIVNLDKSPRNRRGRVEYSGDFCILKPLDMARGNGKIFFDAPNRGAKRILSFLNDAPATNDPSTLEHAGNGFLMRQGYTIVWCGWQGDLSPVKNWLALNVPVATNKGNPITSKIRTEIVVDEKGVKSQPLSADERVKVTQPHREISPRQCLLFAKTPTENEYLFRRRNGSLPHPQKTCVAATKL